VSVGLQRLRDDADTIRDGAVRKGEDPTLVDRALDFDAERRRLLAEGEALKAERNTVSKQIGEAIKGGAAADGPEVAGLREASTAAGEKIKTIDDALAAAQATRPTSTSPSAARKRTSRSGPGASLSPMTRASPTGSSGTPSTSSTTRGGRRSPVPGFPSTRAPDRPSSAGSSTGSSTSTRESTG
jgi:hypothetical protein